MRNTTGLKNNEPNGNGYWYNFNRSPVYRIKNDLLRNRRRNSENIKEVLREIFLNPSLT